MCACAFVRVSVFHTATATNVGQQRYTKYCEKNTDRFELKRGHCFFVFCGVLSAAATTGTAISSLLRASVLRKLIDEKIIMQVIYSSPGPVQCVSSRRNQWGVRYVYIVRARFDPSSTPGSPPGEEGAQQEQQQQLAVVVSSKALAPSSVSSIPTMMAKDTYVLDVSTDVLDCEHFDAMAAPKVPLPANVVDACCVEVRNPTSTLVRLFVRWLGSETEMTSSLDSFNFVASQQQLASTYICRVLVGLRCCCCFHRLSVLKNLAMRHHFLWYCAILFFP